MYTPTNTQISELIQRARNQGVSLNFSQAKKYLIDNILSSLNIIFQKSNLLNLVNLDGEKTFYT